MSDVKPSGLDIFASFWDLRELNDESEVQKKLKILEACLADNSWVNQRIIYLEASLEALPETLRELSLELDDSSILKDIPNPLSKGQLDAIPKMGIVKAWEAGYINAAGLSRLAHSIAGLRALNDALFSAMYKKEELAECWKTIADQDGLIVEPIEQKIKDSVEGEE